MPDLFSTDTRGEEGRHSSYGEDDRSKSRGRGRPDTAQLTEGTIGGRNLRQSIRTPFGQTKPRSSTHGSQGFITFAGPAGRTFVEPTHRSPQRTTHDDNQDDDISEYTDDVDDDEIIEVARRPRVHFTEPGGTLPPTTPPTEDLFPVQPFPGVVVRTSSALGSAMAITALEPGASNAINLQRQTTNKDEPKLFRQEVLETTELLVFAFMRPGSVFIHLVHSLRVFTNPLGDPDSINTVFGFVGDQVKPFRQPMAVSIPDKMLKWVSRKVILDITHLEEFFITPDNKKKFFRPNSRTEEQSVSVPRLLLLSPLLAAFCCEAPRTPFDLHQFAASIATDDTQLDFTINDCTTLFDWCITASHHESASTTSSTLATLLHPAPAFDDVLHEWLHTLLANSFSSSTTPGDTLEAPTAPLATDLLQPEQPSLTTPPRLTPTASRLPTFVPPPVGPPPMSTIPPPPPGMAPSFVGTGNQPNPGLGAGGQPPYGIPPPPPDMWAQIAANLTHGIASVAAALQPVQPTVSHHESATGFENGGKEYDEFQVAILRGFAHSHNIADIPKIWPMFQYTKHIETHRDNIRREMIHWAKNAQPDQVPIDRGVFFPNSVMKDILALRFNPGGPIAEAITSDQGLSILICRPRTTEGKAAMRRREQLEATSKRKTVAEAEMELASTAPLAFPDSFHELHGCIGTYCALLYVLFGPRCAFFKHCYMLWTTMNSEGVYELRHLFTPIMCRQILWAIIEYARSYFAQRMSVDDFIGVHPEDIAYPRSFLSELEPYIRTLTPIVRSSFPSTWITGEPLVGHGTGSVVTAVHHPPLLIGGQGGATVVSGVTNSTTPTRKGTQRPPVTIRATNVHPTIKTAMEPYIAKIQALKLSQMLGHVNLTIDDLPTLPASVNGAGSLCYSYVLGLCTHPACPHAEGHVKASDVTDEFATDLISKLRPAITEFMEKGAPKRPKRKRRG